jgi:hypothetical protein
MVRGLPGFWGTRGRTRITGANQKGGGFAAEYAFGPPRRKRLALIECQSANVRQGPKHGTRKGGRTGSAGLWGNWMPRQLVAQWSI